MLRNIVQDAALSSSYLLPRLKLSLVPETHCTMHIEPSAWPEYCTEHIKIVFYSKQTYKQQGYYIISIVIIIIVMIIMELYVAVIDSDWDLSMPLHLLLLYCVWSWPMEVSFYLLCSHLAIWLSPVWPRDSFCGLSTRNWRSILAAYSS